MPNSSSSPPARTQPYQAAPGPGLRLADIWARRLTHGITLFVYWWSGHWLLMANLALAILVFLPLLAPLLAYHGYDVLARLIYLLFQPLCHQLPERSFFLFGDRWTYSYTQLVELLSSGDVAQRWIGALPIGFKVAVCERDMAIYSSLLLGGLVFALVRNRLAALSLRQFGVLVLPMAIDGTGQLVGLWNSTWVTRVLTGSLFGIACVWFSFPHLEGGMKEIHLGSRALLQEQRSNVGRD